MAVVSVVDGKKDFSRIYVAYAGTNFDDLNDVGEDLRVVGLGNTREGTQAYDAMKFAADLEKFVKDKHPGASIETVGHSLGGFVAQYVAAEKRLSATTFNAPDAWDVLSPQTKDWLTRKNAAGANPLRNIVNEFDTVGNLKGNGTGAADYVKDVPGRDLLAYHNLGKGNSFAFDATGEVVGAGASKLDFGVVLYNLGQPLAAKAYWAAEGNSRYGAVLVAMEPAISLANTIGGLAAVLKQIKGTSGGVVQEMEEELARAQSLYMSLHPSVTMMDIEQCVDMYRLRVNENIDQDAIDAVDKLIAGHITKVNALRDGIHSAVTNALIQDGQAAAGFNG